jgi:hypothetical protein
MCSLCHHLLLNTHLNAVLTSLQQHRLFYQLPECEFALSKVRYLGHLDNAQGAKPDPKKVSSIDSWTLPLDLVAESLDPTISAAHLRVVQTRITKQVSRLLGFMQYFSRRIPHLPTLQPVFMT